jgi:hypothetical protein
MKAVGESRLLSHHTPISTHSFNSLRNKNQQELDQERKRQEARKDRQKQAYFDVRTKEMKFKTEVEELEVRKRVVEDEEGTEDGVMEGQRDAGNGQGLYIPVQSDLNQSYSTSSFLPLLPTQHAYMCRPRSIAWRNSWPSYW